MPRNTHDLDDELDFIPSGWKHRNINKIDGVA